MIHHHHSLSRHHILHISFTSSLIYHPTMASPTANGDELSDEEMRKLLKPNCSPEQVLEVIRQSYCKDKSQLELMRALDSYDDQNFWIKVDGTSFLAKVHNGVESNCLLYTSPSPRD